MLAPSLSLDLFSDETRNDPYSAYRELRDAGEVCHLDRYGIYAVGRHQQIRDVLTNWQDFSSASGVALNDLMNRLMAGTVLTSDPPEHSRLRQMLGRPISPAGLAQLRPRMAQLAEQRVAELVGSGNFEAMAGLATLLPLSVISELVGLPEEGRDRMLDWADAAFSGMAPEGLPLCDAAFPTMVGMVDYITADDLPGRLRPGSWAAELWDFVEEGRLSATEFQSIVQGYVSPSLDTTIYALGSMLWLLAVFPDQWRALKDDPSLIPRCINEVLRYESPALGFSRVAKRDVELAGCAIPEGSRIITVLPAGNRDERRYEDAHSFRIERDASDHLAFGGGVHRCVGGNLAMLEITAVLTAVVKGVENIEFLGAVRANNAVLRGFSELHLRFS